MSFSSTDEIAQSSHQQRYLTTSTSFGHVIVMIAMGICRRITCGIDLKKRLLVYFCIIVFGGIVSDFAPPIIRAFMPLKVSKHNFFNQWFVKIGWLWTLVLLTPFLVMISDILRLTRNEEQQNEIEAKFLVNSKGIPSLSQSVDVQTKPRTVLELVKQNAKSEYFVRIAINTFVWWFITNFFEWYDSYSASCSIAAHKNREVCVRSGGKWAGFDISGHTFLLLFSNLIILEECVAMVGWESFGDQLNAKQQHYQKIYRENYQQHIMFSRYIIPIRILFILLTLLSILWDFMLVQTALFYHTMIQKFIAFLFALSLWFLLYKLIYKYLNVAVPHLNSRQ
ncbi:FIT family protein CG10671-like protein [Dinothrombium tinctorium]|uniref:FIT family protein CG10671-like protein n=1 Tax=Dinothrombium tinctorium TaxID=1965070 RepID=A0A443RED8_9ACAR|nr:FIT family protein CG10671-like protein [Dinothrombium tinctorium]